MNIVELFARIGLKTDEEKAKSFESSMRRVKFTLLAATTVAAGTALAIRKVTSDAMKAAVDFKQFEIETGSSAQELQKWQAVAEQTNQSAESVTSAIKAIVANQEKIRLGQGNIAGFQLLGIDPRQDPFKILEELRVKTRGLSEGMRKNILSQIGVGKGLIQTLNLTKEQFDEMAGRAWIISPQAIETLNKTKSSLDLAGRAINYMKAQIAVGLSPQIDKATKSLQNFLKANEENIIKIFKLGFEYVERFVKALANAASFIDRIVTSTIGWKTALKILLGALIAFNSALLSSPFDLIAAAIILLIGILDDLYVYFKGGKSLLGELFKSFPESEKTFLGFAKNLKDILSLLKYFSSGDESGINKILTQWGTFGDIVEKIYKSFVSLKNLKLGDIFKGIEDITEEWGVFGKAVQKVVDLFKNPLLKSPEERKTERERSRQRLIDEGINFGVPNVIKDLFNRKPGNTTQNNSINVNITGGSDPAATGDAAAKSIQRSINAASAQLSRDQ